jgi:hypothetical protein
MKNRIRQVRISQPRWDIVEAELWIDVVPEVVTASTEIRGRLMGPRCLFSSTVEVAYPLRPTRSGNASPGLRSRAIIPEPNFWEPQCPFFYEGIVELWEEGTCLDQVHVRHGLRLIQLDARGLRVNGNRLTVRGAARTELSEQAARDLRQGGFNAVVLPLSAAAAPGWDVADRLGLFVIGRGCVGAESPRLAEELSQHPSCLGWIISSQQLQQGTSDHVDSPESLSEKGSDPRKRPRGQTPFRVGSELSTGGSLVIAEVTELPVPSLPRAVTVIACPERLLPELASSSLPRLLLREDSPKDSAPPSGTMPGVVGWIDS